MRILRILCVVAAGTAIITSTATASDWDKAGKTFAIHEGVRVLTGGNVDVVGTLTGINRPQYSRVESRSYEYREARPCGQRVWVPRYEWRREWIPAHVERWGRHGDRMFVAGHWVRYRVECR